MYVTPSCVCMECLFFLCDVYYGLLTEFLQFKGVFLLFQVTRSSFSPALVNMLVQLGVNAMKYAGRFFSTKQPCIPGISLIWYNAKYSVCSWIWFTNTRFRILVSDSGMRPLVCGARLLTLVTLILWSELESLFFSCSCAYCNILVQFLNLANGMPITERSFEDENS